MWVFVVYFNIFYIRIILALVRKYILLFKVVQYRIIFTISLMHIFWSSKVKLSMPKFLHFDRFCQEL